ncbi:SRPBCC domain-containing protein [Spirillospora sp. NPDC049652]
MELDHEFTVPVPVEQAWSVLLDVERVALCMPGATLDSAADEEYQGRLRVRVGAMTITYRGVARIVVADEGSRSLTIDARAKEARGSGTANATVQARLHDEDGTTRVTVRTKLNVTGRPAQFGRNILSEVGGRLIGRFAKALAEELEGSDATAPAERTAEGRTEAARPGAADQSGPSASGGDARDEKPPVPTVPRPRPASPLEQLPPEPAPAAPTQNQHTPDDADRKPGDQDATAAQDAAEDHNAAADRNAGDQNATADQDATRDQGATGDRDAEANQGATGDQGAAGDQGAEADQGTAPAPVTRIHPRREDDAIDLLEIAGPSLAKRAVPAAGGVALLLAIFYVLRRRRR